MEDYLHAVQYYETDKMGFVHHSNYVRWMEEARTDYLRKIGYSYERLEAEQIVSPVVSLSVRYRHPTTYGNTVAVHVYPTEYTGVRIRFSYTMKDENGNAVCEAESEHCFLNPEGRPVRMNRVNPDLHALLERLTAENVPAAE